MHFVTGVQEHSASNKMALIRRDRHRFFNYMDDTPYDHEDNYYRPQPGAWEDVVDEHHFYEPGAWKVALESTHEKSAPSAAVKQAAQQIVSVEYVQQATGWLLLTQTGGLLGSFGQLMPPSLCLLSLFIFMLEVTLKLRRNWHQTFFMDIPCAYVPLHAASYDALAIFDMTLKRVLPLELFLFGSYIFFAIRHLVKVGMCWTYEAYESRYCDHGANGVVWLLLFCSVIVFIHGVTSVLAWYTFNVALGSGKLGRFLSAPYSSDDKQSRLLCLTWWVHLARHQHLSAVVAKKEPVCNLPGHWFETVDELTEKLRNCVDMEGDQVIACEGALWDSLTMALNAILCIANKDKNTERIKFLKGKGFDLLVREVREGKFSSCRGLAAAAIASFARSSEAQEPGMMDLSTAVVPLKRLARSKEPELKEVALGALLNIVLDDFQYDNVLTQIEGEDGIVGGPDISFIPMLKDCAYANPTLRCQELAIGILARVAGSTGARNVLLRDGQVDIEIARLVKLLKYGLSVEIKASAAGVLAELTRDLPTLRIFMDREAIEREAEVIMDCTETLFEALDREPRLAYPSARALSNLVSLNKVKALIVEDVLVKKAVELLKQEPSEAAPAPWIHGNGSGIRKIESKSALTQEQVQAEAARILFVLCYQSTDNQELFREAGVIPCLATLLESQRPKVYTPAIFAFTMITWDRANQDMIATCGGTIPRMVAILKEKDIQRKEKAVEKVLLALCGIVRGHGGNRDTALQAGIMNALESIQEKSEIYKGRACSSAEGLKKMLTEDLEDLS